LTGFFDSVIVLLLQHGTHMAEITYTVKVDNSGTRVWYLNGKRHREDGPAYEWADGTRVWYLNGQLHREDGPAYEWADGTREWYLNGQLHREGGPAYEGADGTRVWYLNGDRLSEKEFLKRTKTTCDGKVVVIDGVRYRLVVV
jgi:antitoxin component YwqK of YwqJK toxin-antitoxin module